MQRAATAILLAASFAAPFAITNVRADDRLPTIPPAQYDADQKKAAVDFEAARKTPVYGPFEPLMHSPEVMSLARSMGDYLRYKSSIGNTLSEFVILVTARGWSQDYEWSVHAPIALKAGIRKELVDAVADGRRPTGMSADEEMTYDFVSELIRNRRVSDPTYRKVQARFGDKGVVDMTGIVGYYTFLAMQLNVGQYHPKDGTRLVRMPE
jgi:4-carboxymuconolactone decarboxylase